MCLVLKDFWTCAFDEIKNIEKLKPQDIIIAIVLYCSISTVRAKKETGSSPEECVVWNWIMGWDVRGGGREE